MITIKVIGENGFVVARLILLLERDKHKVYFDNYFAYLYLVIYLKEKRITMYPPS